MVAAATVLWFLIAVSALPSPCPATIVVTDEMGSHVSLPTKPKRMVVLTGYPAEVICALGAGNRIVGICSPEKEFLPEIRRKPSLGQSSVNPNLEKLLELNPDLVIAYQWTKWVVQKDPDIIIKIPRSGATGVDISTGYLKQLHEEIMQREELRRLQAIRQNRVFVIHPRLCAGPRQIIGTAYYAKWFYPALFPDLDPGKLHAQMLKRFWGLDLHGAWGYPEND
ncbi:putative ABC transporter, periplasmic binding protein [Desulfosarcina variabilis str. Montpellier]